MRTMTDEMAAELDRTVKRPALFYEGEFASGFVRIWTGDRDVEFNGETFVSATRFVGAGVSAIEETGDVEARGIAVSLSGVPLEQLQIAIEEARQGMPGTVWLGFVSDGSAAEYDYDLTPGVLPGGVTYEQPTADFDGSSVDADGVLQYASGPDEPRWEHRWDGSGFVLAGLLNEPERTNSVLRNRNLGVSPWTNVGAATVGSGVGADGATENIEILDSSVVAFQGRFQDIAVADNSATHLVSFLVPKTVAASHHPGITMSLLGGSSIVVGPFNLNTDTGVATATAATAAAISIQDGGAWWKVTISLPNNTSGNTTLRTVLIPARSIDGVTSNVAATGATIFDFCQVELNAASPSSEIVTSGTPATRAASVVTITPLPDGLYDVVVTRWGVADQVLTGVEVTGNAWVVPTSTAPLRQVRMLRRRPEGALVAYPAVAFRGRLDVPEIEDDGQTATVTISYESRLVDLERPRERRYTHEDQQIDYPGDLGFEYVAAIQEWNGVWGRS